MIARFFFWRELKAFPLFFFLLALTLFLGGIGLIGIHLVSGQIQTKLQENALDFLTSDFVVSARREFTPLEKKIINDTLAPTAHDSYRVVDIYSMLTRVKNGQSRLVEIRSIEDGYPFYGELKLKKSKLNTSGLYLSIDLLNLMPFESNEFFKIGELKLKVTDTVISDSSIGIRGFSLAPRIYLPLKLIYESGLLKPGATGSFAYHYHFHDKNKINLKELRKKIFDQIKDPAIKVTLPEDSSNQTGRVIEMLSHFMSLSALVGMLLALVGIFYLYQSHLLARIKDLALLHLYGLSKGHIALGILAQFTLVFIFVIVCEIVLIIPSYKFFVKDLSLSLGMDLPKDVNLSSLLTQIPFLYLLSLFLLMPILSGLMRSGLLTQLKSSKHTLGKFRPIDFMPFLALLWLFSSFLSDSFKIGSIFFISLVIVGLIALLCMKILQWLFLKFMATRSLGRPHLIVGIALKNIIRSGHKQTMSFLALTLGATLISLILQLDVLVQNELKDDSTRPSLFLFDIQEDQLDELISFSKKNKTPLASVTPLIRARLVSVNGEKFELQKKDMNLRDSETDDEARARNTGLNLTIRDELSASEKIVKGLPFPKEKDPGRVPYVSLEKRWAQRMGVSLDDMLIFDIQGIETSAVVRNFREVKWTSFKPNFFVAVESGHIDLAPKTFLGILETKDRKQKGSFQNQVNQLFPNISFIDVEELIKKVNVIFEKSQKAIGLISWLSLGVGLIILYGLSHDQVYRRYYDLALMKSLGLSSAKLRLQLLVEFGLIFFLALILGFFLGWGLAQILGHEVFKLEMQIDLMRIFVPMLAISILCLATLLFSSWHVLKSSPRELLKE